MRAVPTGRFRLQTPASGLSAVFVSALAKGLLPLDHGGPFRWSGRVPADANSIQPTRHPPDIAQMHVDCTGTADHLNHVRPRS